MNTTAATTTNLVKWQSEDREWSVVLNRRENDYELRSTRWGMVASYGTVERATAEYPAIRARKEDSAAYRYFKSVGR
jgi:putative SOS response-associated peptidase YedK